MINKFGGFGGGNMQQLMKQAQRMQEELQKAKEEVANTKVTGVAQNDMVVIEMTGDRQVLGVHINSQIIDPNDSELLEDLIYVALKDALNKIEELNAKKLGPLSGGLL